MIISMTPLRVSFLGGGTDYPEHFLHHGGATLSTSIDKYIYITVSRLTSFFEHRIRVSYSKTELCRNCDEVEHPSVRECLKHMEIDGGVEINVVSDLPARTGLGSSSSFTVGLLHALHAFKGHLVTHEQLAQEAVQVERERIKERVGFQDQYAAACGGLLHLQFLTDNRVDIQPITLPPARIEMMEKRLLMFYTGQQRSSHEVLEQQIARTSSGILTDQLLRLRLLVADSIKILGGNESLAAFGDLLHEAWNLKRQFSNAISNSQIDAAYEAARKAGATGGKLLGAGGGGFLLLYVEPEKQSSVRTALGFMREVVFQFENHGSRLIFYKP